MGKSEIQAQEKAGTVEEILLYAVFREDTHDWFGIVSLHRTKVGAYREKRRLILEHWEEQWEAWLMDDRVLKCEDGLRFPKRERRFRNPTEHTIFTVAPTSLKIYE